MSSSLVGCGDLLPVSAELPPVAMGHAVDELAEEAAAEHHDDDDEQAPQHLRLPLSVMVDRSLRISSTIAAPRNGPKIVPRPDQRHHHRLTRGAPVDRFQADELWLSA